MSDAPKLPGSLRQNPRLDDWIRIDAADTITIRTGKVELGQGILTALVSIAAEELDVAPGRIRVESADSARAPNEFMTVGSMSIEQSGSALRQAAADARRRLLLRAADKLGLDADALSVEDGIVRTAAGAEVSYWELAGGRPFEAEVSAEASPKAASAHRLIGARAQRIDLPAKVFGQARFVQDLCFEDMLHARVVRPPTRDAKLVRCDASSVETMAGVVAVVRDGNFLAVVAEREHQASAAAERLREHSGFEREQPLGQESGLHQRLTENLKGSYPLVDGVPTEQPVPPLVAPESALHTLRASYTRPYLMHGSIGPSAAVARCDVGDDGDGGERVTIWSSTQGPSMLAPSIALVLQLEPQRVRVIHVEGPGCYGHNGSDDAALDAALCARALPGRHVRLIWSRQDEHAHEPYGPAMRIDMQASLDTQGRIVAWNHDVYSTSHIGRAMPFGNRSSLLAAQEKAEAMRRPSPRPALAPQAGLHRNADPYYDFDGVRVVKHLSLEAPLRASSLRSLGANGNVFAAESMLDELAAAADIDPVQLRLRHLKDPRAKAVIEACIERAGAHPGRGDDPQRPRGRGFAFSRYENYKCYAAVLVELEVDLASHNIHLLRAVIAADAGQIIDPDGLENQLEGGFIQAASWALKEQVRFDDTGIQSLDWESYPILRFDEVPPVVTVLLDQPDEPSVGAGEGTSGPTPAAIANAVFDATGVRLRDTPFSPARLRAALFDDAPA
ncbi:MAG: molybdopterin-dependent oxidoreductase [Myxococcales bacterium]|nr:molybdopterin-dependent oxidoreductase [Myxococcales bacterium]